MRRFFFDRKFLKIFQYISFIFLVFVSCKQNEDQGTDISFYYWKSVFTSKEEKCLKLNECKNIYIRYFDLIKEGQIRPVAIIQFIQIPWLNVIPVVFIKNEVFNNTDSITVDSLVQNTAKLVRQINLKNKLTVNEIQFDCDWTEKTQKFYFYFLKQFGKAFPVDLSATIRLHQVKYKFKSGIPPVKRGVLMYYNMGKINSDTSNSIYDRNLALKYLPYLKSYTLPLSVALPVFGWGIQSRDGKVIALLNKMNETDFIADTNFAEQARNIFRVKNYCFKSGFYFVKNDLVKLEFVLEKDLMEMAEDLNSNLISKPKEIIFYDLDTINLNRYNENICKKVADNFK